MTRRIITGVFLIVVMFFVGYLMGMTDGVNDGARQMARHILNPAFKTDSFVVTVNEECGNPNETGKCQLCGKRF